MGWTKSKKRVCIEGVPRISSEPSVMVDGGHCSIDSKWLDAHPVTKNQYSPGLAQAILRPGQALEEGGQPDAFLLVDGEEAWRVRDFNQSWSWCDY